MAKDLKNKTVTPLTMSDRVDNKDINVKIRFMA